jgi:hypothetical protein
LLVHKKRSTLPTNSATPSGRPHCSENGGSKSELDVQLHTLPASARPPPSDAPLTSTSLEDPAVSSNAQLCTRTPLEHPRRARNFAVFWITEEGNLDLRDPTITHAAAGDAQYDCDFESLSLSRFDTRQKKTRNTDGNASLNATPCPPSKFCRTRSSSSNRSPTRF